MQLEMNNTRPFLVTALACVATFGFHGCKEGHVCVYYRGNALLPDIADPGWHWQVPLLTTHHNVQTTWQTDRIVNVVCGSSKGGTVHLDVDVINRIEGSCVHRTVQNHTVFYDKQLIEDYVPSEVAQFCKNFTIEDIVVRQFDVLDEVLLAALRKNVRSYDLADCLRIKTVRIRRPTLNAEMKRAFESIEAEKKKMDLAVQRKNTLQVELQIKEQDRVMEEQRKQKTMKIQLETRTLEANASAARQKILDDKELATAKARADAERYALEAQAAGNKALYGGHDNFIRVEGFKAAHNNAKLIMGNSEQNALSLLHLQPPTAPTAHNATVRNSGVRESAPGQCTDAPLDAAAP